MNPSEFDVLVLGGGSAGYAAASKLAAGGRRVGVVDGAHELGGLCILRGCMPTKALLHAAELRHGIDAAHAWGIDAGPVRVDLRRLQARKDELIEQFAEHRRRQLQDGRFELIHHRGTFVDPHTVMLDDGRRLQARQCVVATGSHVAHPAIPGLDEAGYLTSDDALDLESLPGSIVVLGGGPVALEFAQYFARLGVDVSVIQRGGHVLREADPDVAAELERALLRGGIEVHTGTRLLRVERTEGGRRVHFQKDGRELFVEGQEVLHALGRKPSVEGLNLASAGVEVSSAGIRCNEYQQTSAPHIYAAGDCCGPHQVVHLAVIQGEIAAENLMNPDRRRAVDERLLLGVVFTDPQVATVGLSERMALAAGRRVAVATYPFNDHGKSMIQGAREGFVKLVADPHTGEILGAACVGPQGGELIHEIMVAMAGRMTVATLASLPHYHPTLAEIWTYPAEELAAGIRA